MKERRKKRGSAAPTADPQEMINTSRTRKVYHLRPAVASLNFSHKNTLGDGKMTTILIRKGLNGFRYSACGQKGNFLFNASQISAITRHWSAERRNGTVQFIRQLDLYPEETDKGIVDKGLTVGARIRQARGYSCKKCAALADIPLSTYRQIENDQAYISKHKLLWLAVRLQVSSRWLIDGAGPMEIGKVPEEKP